MTRHLSNAVLLTQTYTPVAPLSSSHSWVGGCCLDSGLHRISMTPVRLLGFYAITSSYSLQRPAFPEGPR